MRSLRSWLFVSLLLGACGSIDPGEDFQIAEVVFDEGYYYCRIEPMLFDQRCGSGDPDRDGSGACHANVTTFRLTAYEPLVRRGCSGNQPEGNIPQTARANYQSAQRQMRLDPELAPLLNHPTRRATHPRRIFSPESAQATQIREWATRYSSQ
jgi:hypothetical protein